MPLLPSGKLPPDLLAALIESLPTHDPQLLLGPAVGEDAAVIDFAANYDTLLVAKSDPITFATDEIGYYAVNVCANDLAVTGARPRFYLPTLLLPAGATDADLASRIVAQIGAACRALGIVVAGGHSEITPAVSQPVVAGTMLGEVKRGKVVRSAGAQVSDLVLLAGNVPVEGTSLIAREKRGELLARGWASEEIDRAANFLFEPGISVLQPALLVAEQGWVTALHDPTEGGIATGLAELASAANVGLEIYLDEIVVPDLSRRLCAEFGLDPLGTIASGALIATATESNIGRLMAAWSELGWLASVIGQVKSKATGLVAHQNGKLVSFPKFAVDEITKLWE